MKLIAKERERRSHGVILWLLANHQHVSYDALATASRMTISVMRVRRETGMRELTRRQAIIENREHNDEPWAARLRAAGAIGRRSVYDQWPLHNKREVLP